jgi:cold shock CspA family protein/ribosome-associated translation inhibitor RaiA
LHDLLILEPDFVGNAIMAIPVRSPQQYDNRAVRSRVEELAARLDRFHKRIMACRVVIRAPNRRQRKGRLYHVSIDLTVPGHEITINRNPPEDQAHQDIYVAIRDAFEALTRRLEDVAREARGEIKAHEGEPHGRIARLFPDEGYGFLAGPNGDEIYFHANSVLNQGFKRLRVGSEVRYQAVPGDKGLQATIVKPVGKRHPKP